VSGIDTAVVDSLKVLDLKWPIREADIARFWLGSRLSANDPTATLAVHCGIRFDAGFSPYQSTRLSR
jgi:hypothetical protein